MKKTYWLLASLTTLTLTGCFEGNVTTEELCQKTPELRCENLNMDDGQCRIPRTKLIWHRFELLKNPSEANQITEYSIVADYRKCLELASQITPIDQSELKRQRFNALVHSIDELKRIVEELKGSQQPETLYFLWSQTGDTQARRQFLQMEGTPQLNTAEMQYALATFYTNRDAKKTLVLLNNALALSNKDNLNPVILKSLASINQGLGEKKQAYLWAMVAKRFDVPLADEKQLQRMYHFEDPSQYEKLDKLADTIAKAILKGSYSPDMIPKDM
ncbi:DUF2989 domain-containing protein [Vibrio parahaemolyticus]|uniref:DUF2989 domain-containing protein n=1 Tax=Vibrio parahaemolyticus TaxID=670 RepID=UPI0007A0467C|nr:DUF2989 domain-containing protein [Vibrio parahaemolyticus]EGQ9351773.1 DUF2989 domain-containing protein [Vibrio parahaemolyticus]EGQ9516330.1 DUF2989 domain-containing protein [Vibrio parahaemolyticus]EGR2045069.1 DUF2989 domain-containing protein [Vibrio parahaemolyticus]EIM7932020.1 DUF2989 domain-containing protein [Vibrio parahaemolyticus]EJC7017062.1 DUF2989 domain-containing protein [Vibrio parahaemolyticus]